MTALNVSNHSLITVENLVGGIHFINVTVLLVVTVVDSLDNTFDLGRLDQVKQIIFNSNSESVSSLVVLFEHDLSKEKFIIN